MQKAGLLIFAGCFVALAPVAYAQEATPAAEGPSLLLKLLAPSPGNYDALVSRHALANGVPEALVRRVIHRESRGNPRVVSKGNYGLMQIRLGTARAMGYSGDAQGLLDADTNMTYAVKYLAGAYKAADGNHDRAVALYARGYNYEAKRQGLEVPVLELPGVKALAKAEPAGAADTTPSGAAGLAVTKP